MEVPNRKKLDEQFVMSDNRFLETKAGRRTGETPVDQKCGVDSDVDAARPSRCVSETGGLIRVPAPIFTVGSIASESESERSSVSLDRKVITRRLKLIKRKQKQMADSGSETSQVSQVSVRAAPVIMAPMAMEESRPGPSSRIEDLDIATIFQMKPKKRRIMLKDTENPNYTHPGATKAVKVLPPPPGIATKNRYEGKANVPEDMEVVPPQPHPEPEEVAPKQPAGKKPPPIVIHGKFHDHKKLNTFLSSKLRDSYYWKHSNASTSLQVMNRMDWDIVNRYFEEGHIEYHTYTPKDEKTHAFILKGLHHDVEMTDIKEELRVAHQIEVKQLYTLKGTRHPLYMLVTSNKITLKELQAKIRYVDHTSISWERHVNNKSIIQCHRCQQWGHATSNCRASPRCLKCADVHLTNQCLKSRDEPASCANCGEPHPANSVSCKVYRKKIEDIERRSVRVPPPVQMKYVAAAPPSKNVWEERIRIKAQQQQPASNNQRPLSQQRTQPQPSISTQQKPPLLQTPAPLAQQRVQHRGAPESGMAQLNQLRSETKRMSSLVNLGLLLTRMRELNDQLEGCTTAAEKFEVVYYFLESIPDDAF